MLEGNQEILQGDPNQNLLIQMAITLKTCISEQILALSTWDQKRLFSELLSFELANFF